MQSTPPVLVKSVSVQEFDAFVAGQVVFAIIDPVGQPSVAARLQRLPPEQAASLYAGTQFDAYTAIAPYLVHVDAALFQWLQQDLWSEPWGIFIVSRLSFAHLFHHLRNFLSATVPDGSLNFFRFYDPRVLPPFLASDEAFRTGFWNGIVAYGWSASDTPDQSASDTPDQSDHNAVVTARRPESLAEVPFPANGVVFTPPLQDSLARTQVNDFIHRCSQYFLSVGRTLPADADAFFSSFFRYALSIGITAEIDLIRFAFLVLGWQGLRSVPAIRELLTYPRLDGAAKVDLLCETAAFGDPAEWGAARDGLDPQAHTAALNLLLAKHQADADFQRTHPPGLPLTLAAQDALWRKEWLSLYTSELAKLSKATTTQLGALEA